MRTDRHAGRQTDRRRDGQVDRQAWVMLKLICVFCDNDNAPKMLNLLRNYSIDINNVTQNISFKFVLNMYEMW
jgi:hypothetical protein